MVVRGTFGLAVERVNLRAKYVQLVHEAALTAVYMLPGMSPTVFRQGRFRFFFFSREESRPHVQVSTADGVAKFWIEPQVELVRACGLSEREIRRARGIIDERRGEIRDAWDRHFGP